MIIDGKEYIKIGDAAKLIDRTPLTIKNWYEWAELHEMLHLLPELKRVGKRKTRYYKGDELYKLNEFKKHVADKGLMNDFNRTKWGKRGNKVNK